MAKALLREVAKVSRSWQGWCDLRDQVKRAATSVMLNVSEGAGQPRKSGSQRRHFEIAFASAGEVFAALDAAGELELETGRGLELVRRAGALVAGLVRAAG